MPKTKKQNEKKMVIDKDILAEKAKEQGYSLNELSEIIGRSHTYLASSAREGRGIAVSDIARLSKVLKCEPRDIEYIEPEPAILRDVLPESDFEMCVRNHFISIDKDMKQIESRTEELLGLCKTLLLCLDAMSNGKTDEIRCRTIIREIISERQDSSCPVEELKKRLADADIDAKVIDKVSADKSFCRHTKGYGANKTDWISLSRPVYDSMR